MRRIVNLSVVKFTVGTERIEHTNVPSPFPGAMQAVEGGRISATTRMMYRVSSKPATETVGAHAHRLIVLLLQQSAWHTTPPAHCSMTGIAVAWSGDAWGSHAYSSSPRPFPLSIFFFFFFRSVWNETPPAWSHMRDSNAYCSAVHAQSFISLLPSSLVRHWVSVASTCWALLTNADKQTRRSTHRLWYKALY